MKRSCWCMGSTTSVGRARPRWVLPGCRLPQGLCRAVPQAGDPSNLPEGFFGPSSESGGSLANGTYVGHRLWKLEHPQVWLHPTVSPREGWDDLFGGTTLQSGTLADPEHRTAEPQTGPMALGWEQAGRERKVTSIRAGWEAGG